MSKGNMLLGHARGKVGSLVFSRVNGRQVTRSRAEVVKNPRSRAQVLQRVLLNTVAQAYSVLRPICDHSFQGFTPGQMSMSRFLKLNLDKMRERIAAAQAAGTPFSEIELFVPVGQSFFVNNNYIISTGSLPEVQLTTPAGAAIGEYDTIPNVTENTYAGVIAALGAQRGDQLTLLQLSDLGSFRYARIILDPRNADGTEAPLSTAFVTNGAVALPNAKNEGVIRSLAFATDSLQFGLFDTAIAAGAAILSREKEDGTWMRSKSTFQSHESTATGSAGLDLESAIQESIWGLSIESDRYLNNAGVGNLGQGSQTNTEPTDPPAGGGGFG